MLSTKKQRNEFLANRWALLPSDTEVVSSLELATLLIEHEQAQRTVKMLRQKLELYEALLTSPRHSTVSLY